jgi:hypothetical protein
MGSVTAVGSADYTVVYFTESDPSGAMAHVTAVVVRRLPARPRSTLGQAVREFLTSFRRARRHPRPSWEPPAGWDGASDEGGSHEVLHSRLLRRVRVAGREFPFAPRGQTLLLLVDERPAGTATATPTISPRVLVIPPVPVTGLDGRVTEAEHRRRSRAQSELVARQVDAALAGDAAVRALVPMWHPRDG